MSRTLTDRELLGRVISFDTTSRNSNLPLIDFLSNYLDEHADELRRFPSPDGSKANLFARFGPPVDSEQRRGLVLSGHLDVVPAEEPEWRSHPFVMQEIDETFVGRGAADMKGFIAIAVNAAVSARSLRAPLILLFTYDEELGCLGAADLVRRWPADATLPSAAIIGEPTSLRVARMHKGHLKLRIRVHGQSAHSGYPHLGVNAVEHGARVVTILSRLRESLEAERSEHSHWFGAVPFAALNVATIEAGTAVNIIPGECVIEVGIRPLPGMDSDAFASRVEASIREQAESISFDLEVISSSPPMLLGEDAPIHRRLCRRVEQADSSAVSFATDAGWLQQLGLDCVLFGPGSIEVAHRANEYLPKQEFRRGAQLVESVIREFCIADEE